MVQRLQKRKSSAQTEPIAYVVSHGSAPLERYACSRLRWQFDGGGLHIAGTATLTDTNVFENEAYVCSYFELSLNLDPPSWKVTCDSVFMVGSMVGDSTSMARQH